MVLTYVCRGITALSCLLACLLAGCQAGPRINGYIESMAAERRALEDRVYQLEYDLDIVQTELEHVRAENERLRGGGASSEGNRTTPRSVPRALPRRGATEPRESSAPSDNDTLLKPPTIDPGDADGTLDMPPPRSAPPAERERTPLAPESPPGAASPPARSALPPPARPLAPPAAPPAAPPRGPDAGGEPESRLDEPLDGAADGAAPLAPPLAPTSATRTPSGASVVARATPSSVASLALIPRLTGGVDLDDSPGDDGVTVALDLRDDAGRPVTLPGPISVVVLDLAQQGPGARVARWDLDADQVQRLLPDGPQEDGMVLHMAWPGDPPKREQLQLHVRYVTEDGRKLEAHSNIRVRLPGQRGAAPSSDSAASGGWRARTTPREGSASSGVVPASAHLSLPPLGLPPLPGGGAAESTARRGTREAPRDPAPAASSPARPAWRPER